jgi:prephenate dehydrogenase
LRSNVQRATQVWTGIGAKVVTMTHEAHDSAFAAVSHLPHLLAFAFTNAIAAQPQGERFLELAGPGFRDFTRIAASDPAMWRDVLLANREQVLLQSQAFRDALTQLEAMVASGNAQALEDAIAAASRTRAQWQPGAAASPD